MAMLGNKDFYSRTISVDVLVIGAGLAGLLSALRLVEAGASVVVACKSGLNESNTRYAQGGLAASLNVAATSSLMDSTRMHLEDTLRAGAGLAVENSARSIIEAGQSLFDELSRYGVTFDHDSYGNLSLALEGGHHRARVLHNRDATGASITSVLTNVLRNKAGKATLANDAPLRILEHAYCLSLINYEQVCLGAYIETGNEIVRVLSQHTILATGGLGQVYARTTNPTIATGDGIALAYRAGADLVDLEFIQFHPTVLAADGVPPFLLTEAMRGAGATLLDAAGNRFMPRFHLDAELATRDIVARAIHSVMQEQGGRPVYLDLRPIGTSLLQERFPNVMHACQEFGLDPWSNPLPVSPAAHYSMGGILADVCGRTSVERLYAIGECASTGLHGANRLASNSLLEAGVMALQVSDLLKNERFRWLRTNEERGFLNKSYSPVALPDAPEILKQMMYRHVGLVRNGKLLRATLNYLREGSHPAFPTNQQIVEQSNLGLVSELITRAALMREESRGGHFRDDYPLTNDALFQKRQCLSAHDHNWLSLDAFPIASLSPSDVELAPSQRGNPVMSDQCVTNPVPEVSNRSGQGS
jgi:L-aspartate oxidase